MFAPQPTAQGEQASLQSTKHGIVIVANLGPTALDERMQAIECFQRLVPSDGHRCFYIRIRLRSVNLHETLSAWLQDRDFGIALVSLQGLTIQQEAWCERTAGRGRQVPQKSSVMQWVSDASVLECVEGTKDELTLKEFTERFDTMIQEYVQDAICLVQEARAR